MALLLLLAATTALPCSTFCLPRDGETVFGRNYDDTGLFTDYSPAENLELMARSYAGTSFRRGTSRAAVERDARYSDSWTCAPSRARAVRK